jgi:hypothetical protein
VTVFIVRTGSCIELDNCLNVILNYLEKYNIKSFVLKEKIYDLHESWYKLKAFDYINDDFILSWDLDLLPKKDAPNIIPFLNFNKLNMAKDTAVLIKNYRAFNNKEYFVYNCGLVGIPLKYKSFCDKIFQQTINKKPNANNINPTPTEQDIINEELYKDNYKDVHEIDHKFNTLYYTNKENIKNLLSSYVIHYTSADLNTKQRNILTNKHYKNYFNLK